MNGFNDSSSTNRSLPVSDHRMNGVLDHSGVESLGPGPVWACGELCGGSGGVHPMEIACPETHLKRIHRDNNSNNIPLLRPRNNKGFGVSRNFENKRNLVGSTLFLI